MSFLTDEDHNTYNDIRPVFIGECPECDCELDEEDYNERHWEDIWYECPECGYLMHHLDVYTI